MLIDQVEQRSREAGLQLVQPHHKYGKFLTSATRFFNFFLTERASLRQDTRARTPMRNVFHRFSSFWFINSNFLATERRECDF